MQHYLVISIRFLDGRYHGRTDDGRASEWPPSPMRLFQAMVAGAKARWSDARVAAFEWLERRNPPLAIAPDAEEGRSILTYVPNNNDPGTNIRTAKSIRPRLLKTDRLVEYVWPLEADGDDLIHAETLASCARHVRALGWGIDLAIGNGQITDQLPVPNPARRTYRPVPNDVRAGSLDLRVPAPGSIASLERVYAGSLSRFATPGTLTIEADRSVFATVSYSASSHRPFCAFRFVRDEDDPAAYRPAHIKQIAGQLRHLAAAAAMQSGIDRAVIDGMIHGHPTEGPRLSILPLPSVGHRHVDGLIRRVAFVEPFGSDGALCEALSKALQGKTLAFEGACGCAPAELDRIGRGDPVVRHYRNESRAWASTTPVLLPGHNERRQQRRDHVKSIERAQALVCKSLQQAGIDTPAEVTIDQVPFWPGTLHARQYDPRDKLAHLPRYHVLIKFDRPISGPLSIGAGRHVGFGILAGCDEE